MRKMMTQTPLLVPLLVVVGGVGDEFDDGGTLPRLVGCTVYGGGDPTPGGRGTPKDPYEGGRDW